MSKNYEKVEVNSERWFNLKPLLNEEFRDIVGYEGLYQVSNYGRVKSLERVIYSGNKYNKGKNPRVQKEKILKLQYDKDNYLRIGLYINNKKPYLFVHRLVALVFLNKKSFKSMPYENRDLINLNNLKINHKNENKADNIVDNLEWCTTAYNNCYGKRIKNAILKVKKPIKQYDINNNFIKDWDSPTTASKELNICKSSIINCCNKKAHSITAGGYIWKYTKEK